MQRDARPCAQLLERFARERGEEAVGRIVDEVEREVAEAIETWAVEDDRKEFRRYELILWLIVALVVTAMCAAALGWL